MTKKMVSLVSDGVGSAVCDNALWPPFLDLIQPGDQGRISGKEPEKAVIGLTRLGKMKSVKCWLSMKYVCVVFVDKNPDGDDSDKPLTDEDSQK